MAFRLMRYMLQAGSTEKPGPLIRELAKQSPVHKELMMTIAEWLEGRKENSRSIALKMLASGLDPKMVMELTGLSGKNSPRSALKTCGAAYPPPHNA